MPVHNNVETISSNMVWQKGDRSIWEVSLNVGGQLFKAKTYSQKIAQQGWKGDIETYEKAGRNGSETFVKQPEKEGGYQNQSAGGRKSSSPDSRSFYDAYAKDIVVALITTKGELNKTDVEEAITLAVNGGSLFYEASKVGSATVASVFPGAEVEEEEPEGDDVVVEDLSGLDNLPEL